MIKLYDKRETDEQIEFEFRHLPLANGLFFLMLAAALSPRGRCPDTILRVSGLFLILWMVGLVPAWLELEEAMRSGSVIVSGSKFSCSKS